MGGPSQLQSHAQKAQSLWMTGRAPDCTATRHAELEQSPEADSSGDESSSYYNED